MTIAKLNYYGQVDSVVYSFGNTKALSEDLPKASSNKGQKTRIENKKKTFATMCGKTVEDVEEALSGKVLLNDDDIENTLDKWIVAKNGGEPVEYKRS